MFERALLPLDLSPAAELLIARLPALRRALGLKEVILVHVAPPAEPLADVDTLRSAHQARLGALARAAERHGVTARTEFVTGALGPEVARLAEAHGAGWILVGSRSRSRIREAFLGSGAREILQAAPVPVYLVPISSGALAAAEADPAGVRPGETGTEPDHARVVLATDFSPTSERAFAWLLRMARHRSLDVLLLHATTQALEEDLEAEDALETLAERLREVGARSVRTLVARPAAAEAVLAALQPEPPPLLVLGTHGRGFVKRTLFGSVTREVASRASSPLLLVPPGVGR